MNFFSIHFLSTKFQIILLLGKDAVVKTILREMLKDLCQSFWSAYSVKEALEGCMTSLIKKAEIENIHVQFLFVKYAGIFIIEICTC